jgi:DNA-binding transcriptional LysR family regulator
MDRFVAMSVFVAVAEGESFAAAARRLGMSPPSVTRIVNALEQRLGVHLLNRTTRMVRVTEAGARYLDDARRVLAEADEADAAAAGASAVPRGQLSVTAPAMFGRLYVMRILAEYQQAWPDTQVSALLVDRVVNLMEEGLDVGIRIGALPDSSLHAIPVGRVRRLLVAAPAYLAKHGTPELPQDLRAHRIISSSALPGGSEWSFGEGDKRITVKLRPAMQVNTNDGALEGARLGFGIARLVSYQAAPQLASGELQTVLEAWSESELPVHVVHREGRHASAKVRRFVELAVERLRGDPALNWPGLSSRRPGRGKR